MTRIAALFCAVVAIAAGAYFIMTPAKPGSTVLDGFVSAAGAQSGEEVDTSGIAKGGGFVNPAELIRRTTSSGSAPVVEDRVPFRVWLPFQAVGVFEGYDFATRQIQAEPINGSELQHDGTPLFMGRLRFTQRGADVDSPEASDIPTSAARELDQKLAQQGSETAGNAEASDLWVPLDELKWNMEQREFDRVLRERGWASDRDSNAGTVTIQDINVLAMGRADVRASFSAGRLIELVCSYRNPPTMAELIAANAEAIGQPTRTDLSENAYDLSEAQWGVSRGGESLDVTLTATQGNASVVYRYQASP